MNKTGMTEEVRRFLQKPLIARLSTVDKDGYPHTVPVWFDVDGDDVIFISVRDTLKIGHIQANSKGSVSIGGQNEDGGGYLIKGQLSIEEDPGDVWMKRLIYRYESGPDAERDVASWAELDIVLIRLQPSRIVKVA
ncbi:MAG: pyridoxamine 5'-phosphate oxidase family protein [Anaerolineae bacterium]|nr:pyridoxamine 5'-phosphate oxidase family protein [Anaerolineae bacterium]